MLIPTCKRAGFFGLMFLVQTAAAAPDLILDAENRSSRTLTIYQQDLALFTETYPLAIEGTTTPQLRLDDVSERLHPDSLFSDGIGPLRRIQLMTSNSSIIPRLKEHLGQEVTLIHTQSGSGEEISRQVQLIGAEGGGIQVAYDGGTEYIPFSSDWRVRLPSTDEPLSGTQLLLEGSEAAGKQLTLSYLSGGMNWQASYQLELLSDIGKVRLDGRATLRNDSGTDLKSATVRLLAGSVNQPQGGAIPMYAMAMEADIGSRGAQAPQRESTQDYQLYPLDLPVDLNNNESLSVPLLPPLEMPVQNHYRFTQQVTSGTQSEPLKGHPQRDISFTLPNDKERDTPLPAGAARVYARTEQRGLIFIGGQQLRATAAGEEVTLTLGEAFDLTVEQVQTQLDRQGANTVVGYRIRIRNSGDEDKTVEFRAVFHQPRMMLESSLPGTEEGAVQLWEISVPAGGEEELEYSARLLQP